MQDAEHTTAQSAAQRFWMIPGLLTGTLVGGLVTASLISLLYLAEQGANLPFVPFDLFDWLTRVLPGDVITRGIDTMVKLIDRLDLGETSSTAKHLEQLGALLTFWGGGVVMGAVLFAGLRRLDSRLSLVPRALVGLLAGLLFGLPLILISQDVNISAEAPDSVQVAWLVMAFLAWGGALGWLYDRRRTLETEPGSTLVPTGGQGVEMQMLSRHVFLIRVGGAAATITVIGTGVGLFLQEREERRYQARIRRNREAVLPQDLPNVSAALDPAPGTRPEYTPLENHYRIDINLRPPELDEKSWRLRFSGLVADETEFTLDEIKTYPSLDQYVTLACISNPIGGDLTSTTRWTGVSLQEVLADVGVQDGATHLKITSADGFFETVALDLIRSDPRIMLAYDWDGIPLLYKHGFPLRIYIPDHYGMKQPKWITDIEVIDHDEDGYWVERGWDKTAQMRATAVIDVVASDFTFARDGLTWVPVGGIAHAGARGISRVEVKVDERDWMPAQLREPLSDTTWVIWRYDWPFATGDHTFAMRCYEGDGTEQITERHSTKPSGATGIHHLTRDF